MGIRVQGLERERVTRKRDVIFPQGLVGFEHAKRFRVVERGRSGRENAFFWLESKDARNLRFLALRPDRVPNLAYEPSFAAEDLAWIGCGRTERPEIVVLAARRGKRITANLQAPLVIHAATGMGKQIILDHESYATEAPVLLLRESAVGAV